MEYIFKNKICDLKAKLRWIETIYIDFKNDIVSISLYLKLIFKRNKLKP